MGIDSKLNRSVEGRGIISAPDSRTKVMRVPTDEERELIAQAMEVCNLMPPRSAGGTGKRQLSPDAEPAATASKAGYPAQKKEPAATASQAGYPSQKKET